MPILNPNYDASELQKEMAQKNGLKEKEDGESVQLDGITVCEEEDQQLLNAIEEECGKDVVKPKLDRVRIDKFGNPIGDGPKEVETGQCQPFTGLEERELSLGDDDLNNKLNDKLKNLLAEYNPLLEKEKSKNISEAEMNRLLQVEDDIMDCLKQK